MSWKKFVSIGILFLLPEKNLLSTEPILTSSEPVYKKDIRLDSFITLS